MCTFGAIAEYTTGAIFAFSLIASTALYSIVLFDLDFFFMSSQRLLRQTRIIRITGLLGWLSVPSGWFLAHYGYIDYYIEHFIYAIGDGFFFLFFPSHLAA
jgi:hypothetical protein